MKPLKTVFAAVILLAGTTDAFAQDANQDADQDNGNTQMEQLINLYATATMGWSVEQKCRHLGDTLDAQYADNYRVVDEFMDTLLVDEAINNIREGVNEALDSDAAFECGSETIDYAAETFRLTRNLAANIRQLTSPANE